MEIPEIKTRLTLSEVLRHYSLKPDKNLRLKGPFHEDKTPSLQVYYKTHTAYCFSSNCQTPSLSGELSEAILRIFNGKRDFSLFHSGVCLESPKYNLCFKQILKSTTLD